ncbi:MAG: hypothetical protein JNM72_02910 [Deltaproteobacteria bacterium]|nr:hypothetical protein [Deltaproteobacteria bacterium]
MSGAAALRGRVVDTPFTAAAQGAQLRAMRDRAQRAPAGLGPPLGG